MIARLPDVHALMERALELDESWDDGALHEFAITLAGASTGEPDVALIKEHYDRAVELSGDTSASVHIAYAEAVSVPQQDGTEFRAMLDLALAVDPDATPENRLVNLLAHRRARWLASRADELILEDAPVGGKGHSNHEHSIYTIHFPFGRVRRCVRRVAARAGRRSHPHGCGGAEGLALGGIAAVRPARVGPHLRRVGQGHSLCGWRLGDEVEMVRQMRQGRIQAVGLSSVGLSRIDKGVSCLQVPMLFRSYAELDYVRDRIASTLERRIEAKGFVVLNWADGGWVQTFSKTAVRTPEDVQQLKLFTSAGDPETERLFKGLGFRVIPLSMTDMATSLQTDMIDAFSTVPLFAQLEGLYRLAPHMLDVMWTPLIGGTVISRRAWNQIPASDRPALLEAARAAGERLRDDIRAMGDDAVHEMEARGLEVTRIDAAVRAAWQSVAESAYPQLRGGYCPVRSLRRRPTAHGRVPAFGAGRLSRVRPPR